MPLSVKDWRDQPDHTTPINAAALEDLEARLGAYTDSLSANLFPSTAPKVVTSRLTRAMVSGDGPGNGLAPPLMASPPALTYEAAQSLNTANYHFITGYSTVAAGVVPPLSNEGTVNPAFRFEGGPFNYTSTGTFQGAQVRYPIMLANTINNYPTCRIAFDFDGTQFELDGFAPAGSNWLSWRLWVDEQPNCIPAAVTGSSTTSGSNIVTLGSTTGLVVGQEIIPGSIGTFPAGPTWITSIDSSTQIHTNNNAGATASGTINFGLLVMQLKFIIANFTTRAHRRIVVELDARNGGTSPQFYGLNCLKAESVMPPAIQTSRLIYLWDSYGQGVGALNYCVNLASLAGRLLGIADVDISNCIPSTGLTVASGTFGSYQDTNRLNDVISRATSAPNGAVVVIPVSVNDSGASAGTVQTALTTVVRTIQAGAPKAQIVLTESMFPGNQSAGVLAVNTGYAATAAALSLPFIRTASATPPWNNGTGKVTAPANDGNADNYLASDGIHPSPQGNDYLARRLAQALAPILQIAI